MRPTSRPEWETALLWAPVVGVAAASQLKVGLEEPWSGSDAALTATSLLLAAPLLLRRARPVLVAAAVAIALPVQQHLGGSLSFGSFIAVLVAAYAVGRHGSWRSAASGAGLLMAGVVAAAWETLPDTAPELVFPAFYVAATTALGTVVRRLAQQADSLREMNDVLARERDTAAQLAVTAERLRLARELHDSVAHTLTVAVVQAERCELVLDTDPAAARAAARAIQEAGRRGLGELRATVRVLREDERRARPSLVDLPALATASAVDVDLAVTGDPASVPVEVSHELLRVAQEALTNVTKHSEAASATVTLTVARGVELEVVDPGPRRPAALPSGGHGLAGMAERLAHLGGWLEAGPYGEGYRVRVVVP